MKTAIAIRHVAFEDLGTLTQVLRDRGIDVRYFEAGAEDLLAVEPDTFDLAIVLGGPIGAYEAAQYPFLRDEIDWLRVRLTQDLPTLGICLGAQLMAAALGAKVFPGAAGKEIGWASVEPGANAAEFSFLAPLFEQQLPVLHWHGDTFDLPAGARHLAATGRYANQAFAWRHSGLALQFHLEVESRNFERWLIGHACEISAASGVTPDGLRRATRQSGPELERIAPRVWTAWLDFVTGS